jgi:hypothetical protein
MVDQEKLFTRLSRRAALRAGSAAGTAAVIGVAAAATEAQSPSPAPGAQPSPTPRPNYTDTIIGERVRLPDNPAAVRNSSLRGLLLGDPERPGDGRDADLQARLNRIMAKDIARDSRGQHQLVIALLTRAVELYNDDQRRRLPPGARLEKVGVQFTIREYDDSRDRADPPEDIISVIVGAHIGELSVYLT